MAAVKSNVKNYCDSLYKELYHMKIKLGRFASIIEQGKGKSKDELIPYVRHLHDMVSFIEWKMEIFNKVCPIEWSKFGEEVETEVSVPTVELTDADQTPGGYLGG
jgi:hypothetical protein